jgi:hypothetical protein
MTIEAHRRELSTLSIHRNGDCLLKKHPTNKTNMLSMKNSSILMISVDFLQFLYNKTGENYKEHIALLFKLV